MSHRILASGSVRVVAGFAAAATVAAWSAVPSGAFAQGCVCVRQVGPIVPLQGYLHAEHFQVGAGYRWLHSDRHFVGDEEQTHRQEEGSEVINDVHYFDLSITYAMTPRFNATLMVPFEVADRSQVVRSNDVERTILTRFSTQAAGVGDLRLMAGAWILDPEVHTKGNVSLGLGVKFPTGQKGARDTFQVFNAASGQIVAAERTVDQSIQPGDGGYGIIVDLLAYQEVFRNCTVYLAGTYVSTPEEDNGVPTYRSNPFEAVMSIADQYVVRGGASYTLVPEWGLSLSLSARMEGVPAKDVIGDSDGFRRPGFAVSIEPGVTLSRKSYSLSVSAPVAVYRNREVSVADEQYQAVSPTSPARHGDAAFADYLILASLSKRF